MAGWEEKALGEVLRLEYGKPLPTQEREPDGAYPAFGANGVLCHTNEFYHDKPSIIIGRKGSAGEVTLTPPKFWPLDVTYFVDFDERKYDLMFLYHGLKYLNIPRLAKGVKPGINRNDVYNLKLSFPPLAEQRRLVAVLGEAFVGLETLRANAGKNLQNARDIFESELSAIFTQEGVTWVRNPIAKLATKIGSGATPRGGQGSYKVQGVSLIRSMNVHDRKFKYDDLAFLDDEQAEKLDNVVVQENDVLLNITGASVARCCRVPNDVLPARVNQHVSIIRPIQSIISAQFLEYALTARPNKDRLLGVGEKGGSTRQAITKAEIQEFPLAYPPLEAQAEFISRLDGISAETSRLESLYRQKLAAIAELKQSILQKAFSGQLTSAETVAA